MTVTFLVGGATSENLRFEVSSIAELGAALHLMTDPSHHAPLRDIGRRLRSELPERLASEFEALSPLWTGYRCRLLYPLQSGESSEIEVELDRIARLDVDRVTEAIVWGILGGHSRAPSLHAMRTPRGRKDVLDRSRMRSHSALKLAEEYFDDPDRIRGRLMALLEEVLAVLGQEWKRAEAILRADAQLRRRVVEREGIVASLAGLTPFSRLIPDPDRVAFDKLHHGVIDLRTKPLLALPSYYGWPHLLVKHEPGWPSLVQYPLGPVVAHREIPSSALLQQRLSILSDSTRIRVCRLLAREQLSTTELARRTGVSVPQMSRTLRQLRECRLLVQSRSGRFVLYHLDVEAISQLGSDLVVSMLR